MKKGGDSMSSYYNTTLSQFEVPGFSQQDVFPTSSGRERTIAHNFVIISLSEINFKVKNQLYLFDYFDDDSGIRLIGYCVPIFIYRRFFVRQVPFNHREILRRKSGSPGTPHVALLKHVKVPIVSVEPKYPTNWLKFIINGYPDNYPYNQYSNKSYPNNANYMGQRNILNSLTPNCIFDFYNLNNCPYLIPFKTFDCLICYMLIFSNCEENDEEVENSSSPK
uniref:SURF1-like protein n=1 Tax=Strongyloides stercoralis TaxID=6248 RepID=A0A0K0EKN3_STRER